MKIGVLGGGQLGRMMALAGIPLGMRFVFLDPGQDPCAADAGEHIQADYDDTNALTRMAESCDLVTFEFENISPEALQTLVSQRPCHPNPDALATARDRLYEKSLFRALGIAVPCFEPADNQAGLASALEDMGFPAVVKTRTLGYDGKGQALVRSAEDLEGLFDRLGQAPLIVERFVPFDDELSLIAVRSSGGDMVFYPLTRNHHVAGILHLSQPVAGHPLQSLAEDYAGRLMERLNYVGTLGFEFFRQGDALLANEIAPRVHNSGHWTIEGAETSQFENHLRAIAGLPLGSTRYIQPTAMVNCIGQMPPLATLAAVPGLHVHDYRKTARAGRKVGHVTLCAPDEAHLDLALDKLLDQIH
jgi:5-(carboxyamino)imidazole ribonucleotide synthase